MDKGTTNSGIPVFGEVVKMLDKEEIMQIAFFLGKMGVVTSELLSKYRKHSFLVIMLVAAIITPPDLMTLILVTIPLYLLYEISIRVVRWGE